MRPPYMTSSCSLPLCHAQNVPGPRGNPSADAWHCLPHSMPGTGSSVRGWELGCVQGTELQQDPGMLCKAAAGPSPQLLVFVPFCASSASEKGISCYSRSLLFSHGSCHMT